MTPSVTPSTIQPDGQLHPFIRKSVEKWAGDPSKVDELMNLITKSCHNAVYEAVTLGVYWPENGRRSDQS